ncbi:flavodoxin-dependent (E)-4-hydroxy-3-methylbut-2-enyl-diphosphate synthase [Streptomyces formicae]|uniref:1-hydroxy-2-methyl-2-(E)-butenyl 4-diphosphate synthase n=1 Tax=Streptomyces formicae TaxID=1616117 RepID=A0A291QEW1_9ACTN|nr:flavodoxin-dependent (E)-4-hydroxy-3-methylbut-2-enyl-diphosphate synthase [Streptomyces formicae]ATL29993.1 1-hydroxy-2-methyl-2-(E)-butenyl 4-diphosphate synthase [Streptomyces formicae]
MATVVADSVVPVVPLLKRVVGPGALRALPEDQLPGLAGEIRRFLVAEGIGDTNRVSLSADPVEQVKAGCRIPRTPGLRPRKLEIAACPGRGGRPRLQADIHKPVSQVEAAFDGFPHPLRVSYGNGQVFCHGEVLRTAPASAFVETQLGGASRLPDTSSGSTPRRMVNSSEAGEQT